MNDLIALEQLLADQNTRITILKAELEAYQRWRPLIQLLEGVDKTFYDGDWHTLSCHIRWQHGAEDGDICKLCGWWACSGCLDYESGLCARCLEDVEEE